MNDRWKSFFAGMAAILGILSGILLTILGFRGRDKSKSDPGSGAVPTPTEIKSDAEVQIEQTRTEIKSDSDAALAARFNRLAKKEKP